MYPDPETQRPEGDPLHQEHEAVGHQAQQDCADLRPAVPVCSLLGPDLWRRPAGQWPEGGQPEAEDPSGGVCPAAPAGSERGARPRGQHERVLVLVSCTPAVLEQVKPSDLEKHVNGTFREQFPHIQLTRSKIRSFRREMRHLSEECGLEPGTVSAASMNLEKLVLQGEPNKQNPNRAGRLRAAGRRDQQRPRQNHVKQLTDTSEERFPFHSRDPIGFELTVLVALELGLHPPENQLSPHYGRLPPQFQPGLWALLALLAPRGPAGAFPGTGCGRAARPCFLGGTRLPFQSTPPRHGISESPPAFLREHNLGGWYCFFCSCACDWPGART
uniref:Uncharacterized protein n=1 Tax=Balaenoptera musculus TaxID=9771 RepID=A0A8C0DEY7_BALMU